MNRTDRLFNLPWAQARRLEFITETLRRARRINRANLVREFQISTAQASVDLRNWLVDHSDWATYDKSAKAYIATHALEPAPWPKPAEQAATDHRWDLPPEPTAPDTREQLLSSVLLEALKRISDVNGYRFMSTAGLKRKAAYGDLFAGAVLQARQAIALATPDVVRDGMKRTEMVK